MVSDMAIQLRLHVRHCVNFYTNLNVHLYTLITLSEF